MDTAHWLTEFIPKKLSLQEYGFSFLPAFSSIRIEGVSKEGNRKFVQLNFCKVKTDSSFSFNVGQWITFLNGPTCSWTGIEVCLSSFLEFGVSTRKGKCMGDMKKVKMW